MEDVDENGPVWKAGDADGGFGDTLELIHREGLFLVELDEPWAGDTETGFGQTGHITLSTEDAERLWTWLSVRLGKAQP